MIEHLQSDEHEMSYSAACPFAQEIEQNWIQSFPPEQNVLAQVYYDPHFIGFNNENFDRHPDGDAILFNNPLLKFEIHARHKPVNQTARPSVIDAFAIKVKSDTIQYHVDNGKFFVNGKEANFTKNWLFLDKSQTAIVMITGNYFYIYTDFGPRLTVNNCGCYNLNATLTLPRTHAENAERSLFGNLAGGHGQIIQATGLFQSH